MYVRERERIVRKCIRVVKRVYICVRVCEGQCVRETETERECVCVCVYV